MIYDSHRAVELLRLGSGVPDAQFRAGQEEAIQSIIEGKGRQLVVQKTGWGKSFVYFIATKLLRESGSGPALLFSPLVALMRNQIEAARRMGVKAEAIYFENRNEWPSIESAIDRDEVDILLISPERLGNKTFQEGILARISQKIALLVVDEAHCISDWGHDFRPNYRLIERMIRNLPSNLRLLATTATANNRVMEDLRAVLGPNLEESRGDLHRPSLALQTIRLPRQVERLAWLAEQIEKLPGSGIVYTLTVLDAERVAEWLRSRGLQVEAYTAETGDRRPELEQALLRNEVKALVATVALGMGFDKPDLAFVIHYQTPASVIAYYQQVGRAGRALDAAYGVLLSGEEETKITDSFIESAFPTREEAQEVLDALREAPGGLSIHELLMKVNVSDVRIKQTTLLLSLESPAPIVKEGSKWRLTAASISESFWKRVARITKLRHVEQKQMQEYVALTSGHMEFLIKALDGEPDAVSMPDLPALPSKPDPESVRQATEFLRNASLPIKPRKQWPRGGLPHYEVFGRIGEKHRAQPGKALCIWRDAGWGGLVHRGKYEDESFHDDLVEACRKLIEEWKLDPAPTWVTCIPSSRRPRLVPDFARRVAKSLELPFKDALTRTGKRLAQKNMESSTQQAHNVDGAFAINDENMLRGPVLLVDDMVGSGWTLTVAAWLLRSSGSGKVWPLALARTRSGR